MALAVRALVLDRPWTWNDRYCSTVSTGRMPPVAKKRSKAVMALSEEEMLGFVPEFSYTQYCECPNCYGGVQGLDVFTWSVEQPDRMTCRHCGTVYPHEDYPEQRVLTGHNALGEEIRFPYHFHEQKRIPHFLSNHLAYLRRDWIRQQTVALARADRVTKKPEYARRAALILERVADRYPHFSAMGNRHARRYRFLPSQKPPYPWDGGRWGNFHNEIPVDLVSRLRSGVRQPGIRPARTSARP